MSQLQVTGEAKIRDIQGPVVANSGVITALNGAANQYVRGDGTLASFPTSGGGGSSVSYYLNGSVNQGTFGGSTYYQMSKNAIVGSGTNFSTSANGLIAQFITDANDPDVVSIPSGNWNVEFFMSVSASSGSLASFYVEIYKYNGSTFTLLATNVATPEQLTNTTTVDAYFTSIAMPLSSMAITDRLAIRVFANVASKTVTLYTEDNRLCQVVTTFSKGMLSMNNLTDQSQYLTTGTSGTNFAIVSSGDTHTFNIPSASATNRGLITTGTQTIAGSKAFNDAISANYGIALLNGAIPALTSIYYAALSGNSTGLSITYRTGGGTNYTNNLNFPANNNSYLFPSASGTLALTTDISYPVTSVFGRTGAVVATEGDYSLTQLSDVTITTPTNGQVLKYNGTAWINDTDANTGTVTSVGLSSATSGVTIGSSPITTSGTITLAIATASGSQNGLLSSTDWTTFNGKQNSITLTTTGSSGAATLVGSTLNIPNYGSALSGYVTLDTTQTITGLKTFSSDITGQSNIYVTNIEGGVYADYFGRYSTGTTPLSFLYGSTGSVVWNNGGAKMTLSSAGALELVSSISATSATLNGNVIINSTATALSPLQVVATGTIVRLGEQSGTTGKQFLIGIDATSGRSELQSVWQGTSFTSLALQPSGGNVLIGTTGDNGARLQVSGTATFSSNVAIGGTNSTWNLTTSNRLQIGNSILANYGTTATILGMNLTFDGSWKYISNGLASLFSQDTGDHIFFTSSSSTAGSTATLNERMRITNGGNVGIGTSSIANPISFVRVLNISGGDAALVLSNTNGTAKNWSIGALDSGSLSFWDGGSERMRITSGGNVLIGKSTTGVDTNGFRFDSNGVLFTSVPTGENTYYLRDTTNAVYRFYVTSGGTINATNTTISAISDVRLKENITDLEIGLDAIMALKPRKFDWKKESGNDGKNVRGFIAQEFEEIFPDLIDESINKTPEGEPYKQIRQDLIPVLVKAIQEQQAQIEELKAKIK